MSSEKAGGALSGAASGAAAGAAFGPWGAVIGGVVGGVAGLLTSKKPKTPSYQPINTNQLLSQVEGQAERNVARSLALEERYDPATAQLRRDVNARLAGVLGEETNPALLAAAEDAVMRELSQGERGVNLGGAGNLARSLEEAALRQYEADLALGGQLDAGTAEEIVRQGQIRGITTGLGGMPGRRLTLRDLGLAASAVRQARLGRAYQAGTASRGAAEARRGQTLSLASALAGQREGVYRNDLTRDLSIAGLLEARARPEASLSAGSLGQILVDENRAAQGQKIQSALAEQQSAANAQQNIFGGLAGLGSVAGGFMRTGAAARPDFTMDTVGGSTSYRPRG